MTNSVPAGIDYYVIRAISPRTSRAAMRRSPFADQRRALQPHLQRRPQRDAGCCAGRRSGTCCRPRTTWPASSASSPALARHGGARAAADRALRRRQRQRRARSSDGVPRGRHRRARSFRPATPSPSARARRSASPRRHARELHAVDYDAVGLADFGRPEGYLERQVRRWPSSGSARRRARCPKSTRLIRRLRNALPDSPAPTIVHGDYRLGNMMLGRRRARPRRRRPRLGDGDARRPARRPRLHARLLERTGRHARMRPPAAGHRAARLPHPRRDRRRVRAPHRPDVEPHRVLPGAGVYKLAVILEGIHARYLAGETVGEGFDTMGARVVHLVNNALRLADASTDTKLHA